MYWKNLSVYFFLLSCFQLSSPIPGHAQNDIQDLTKTFSNDEIFKHASVYLAVQEIKTGNVLTEKNSSKTGVPASIQKLITNLITLEQLGEGFKFSTKFAYTGEILTDGTLDGDIWIIPSGDPSFGSQNFKQPSLQELLDEWVLMLKKQGITCISGRLICDVSSFGNQALSPSWQWNDLGNYYAAGSWGLNIIDNFYSIGFSQHERPGSIAELAFVKPFVPGLKLLNEVVIGPKGSGDNAYIFGAPGQFLRRIRGSIPPGSSIFEIKGSLPNPPEFFSFYLARELMQKGIDLEAYQVIERSNKGKEYKQICEQVSPSASTLIQYANFKSDNLITESMLRAFGMHKHGNGSLESGLSSVREYINSLQLDGNGIHMEDGSGLSFRNRISPGFMVDFLTSFWNKMGGKMITKYIPRPGIEGTVHSMMQNSEAKGNVWLKSGSMESVLSYAGYIKTKNGSWLSICIIVNGINQNKREIRAFIESYISSVYKMA